MTRGPIYIVTSHGFPGETKIFHDLQRAEDGAEEAATRHPDCTVCLGRVISTVEAERQIKIVHSWTDQPETK